jgi:N-acetyl-1-D-myo-inositol-2-amino-2-deoxy-alpha-D-glucopyranoside deacetylase
VPEVARLYATVVGRATLEAGLAALAGSGSPFRMPEADELPSVAEADDTVTLDVSAHRDARLAALAAHATQVTLWRGPPVAYAMSNRVAQPLLDVEEFVLLSGEPIQPGADDLFVGVD